LQLIMATDDDRRDNFLVRVKGALFRILK